MEIQAFFQLYEPQEPRLSALWRLGLYWWRATIFKLNKISNWPFQTNHTNRSNVPYSNQRQTCKARVAKSLLKILRSLGTKINNLWHFDPTLWTSNTNFPLLRTKTSFEHYVLSFEAKGYFLQKTRRRFCQAYRVKFCRNRTYHPNAWRRKKNRCSLKIWILKG